MKKIQEYKMNQKTLKNLFKQLMMISIEKKELLLMQTQMKKDLKKKKMNLLRLTQNIMKLKKNLMRI